MKLFLAALIFAYSSLQCPFSYAKEEDSLQDLCKKDLNFIRVKLEKNSAPYANKDDKHFHEWYKVGYKQTLELIESIEDKDDCYYAMKYFINGFDQSHISIRANISLPVEMYPGIISSQKGDKHFIVYKHPGLKYLDDIDIGDQLTHVNDIEIDKYYREFIEPFYANDSSEITLVSASTYALLLDGNRFRPIPKTIKVKHGDKIVTTELKYTELVEDAMVAVKKLRQPESNDSFKVEMISNGVWIKIPSFFPTRKEEVYFTGMLSTLKNNLAREDYILFDMRGNRGGAVKWSVPIIRNLWGDDYLKSLGKKHDYNNHMVKKLKVSGENFIEFQKTYNDAAIKHYITLLKKRDDFFLKKWSIYDDKENLYTNRSSDRFKAKIYVLTDSFCRSTCWNFVKDLKQIPNVVHIGGPTSIQGIYSYAKRERVPSENFEIFYPTQIRVKPDSDLGKPLLPSYIYDGSFKDEAQILNWTLSIIEKNQF